MIKIGALQIQGNSKRKVQPKRFFWRQTLHEPQRIVPIRFPQGGNLFGLGNRKFSPDFFYVRRDFAIRTNFGAFARSCPIACYANFEHQAAQFHRIVKCAATDHFLSLQCTIFVCELCLLWFARRLFQAVYYSLLYIAMLAPMESGLQ